MLYAVFEIFKIAKNYGPIFLNNKCIRLRNFSYCVVCGIYLIGRTGNTDRGIRKKQDEMLFYNSIK